MKCLPSTSRGCRNNRCEGRPGLWRRPRLKARSAASGRPSKRRSPSECGGRVGGSSGAAAKLGVPPSTLDHRIKALNINKAQCQVSLKPRLDHQIHPDQPDPPDQPRSTQIHHSHQSEATRHQVSAAFQRLADGIRFAQSEFGKLTVETTIYVQIQPTFPGGSDAKAANVGEGNSDPTVREDRVPRGGTQRRYGTRIEATRWPEKEPLKPVARQETKDQSQGVQLATMQKLARYWATDYDWRKCEARLNALPHFITEIDGLDIHFIHVRSKHEDALPLIVTHGWPGSVIEQLKIVEPLTNPTAHGGRHRTPSIW